uniref:Uncharacterized protein n=1 Tax=Parascaris equorum TaxID=6256 RepID=A0A914RBD0_PAREQ
MVYNYVHHVRRTMHSEINFCKLHAMKREIFDHVQPFPIAATVTPHTRKQNDWYTLVTN